jgi:TolA-binding protein
MNRICDRLKSWSSAAARVGVAGLFVAGLSGCSDDGRDGHDGVAPASSTAPASAPARPETLTLAKQEIKSGKAADAQQRLQGYLKQEPKGPYHAEAEYLMGQSLMAQNDFENGK